MGAPRYGNFLRVFNSIAHEWDVELNAVEVLNVITVLNVIKS